MKYNLEDWKLVKCHDCDEISYIPKNWEQNYYMCLDCGLFREAERLADEKRIND